MYFVAFVEQIQEGTELVSAVHSIDGSQVVHHLPSLIHHRHYPSFDGRHDVIQTGYADEVCITSTTGDASCILGGGVEGAEIAWNAILTDADLDLVDPTNYVSHVVHADVCDVGGGTVCIASSNGGGSGSVGPEIVSIGGSTNGGSSQTTTQLTAVEPHSLQVISHHPSATGPGAVACMTTDDSYMYDCQYMYDYYPEVM